MKKLLLSTVLILITLLAYPQLSYESLLGAFDGFENGEFKNHLIDNNYELKSSSLNGSSETWVLASDNDNNDSQISIKTNTFPWNSIWIVFDRHPDYGKIRNEIEKKCEHSGFFGCSEVETWDSYKHNSGIEFRLIELPDSRETGRYVIEILDR